MTNVGFATIDVVPDLTGFSRKLSRGVKGALGVGGLGAAFGIGSFIKSSVDLEATYSRTMGQMRVATQSSAKEMGRLDDLAIDLGKKTVFSANEASAAMLELAKNGISPAIIKAGALSSALTLAAAGSTDLTFAAQTMGNAINAFGLKGKDSASVAAALAGAANASSASVESLALGLQQAATGANDAGLNIQETTGILAAFANAGISGSDAGTSLKTMLSRLVPTTKKAGSAMEAFGLKFTDANGEFLSATEIAKELKTGLGDLSAEERSMALNAIFGSDARRAATILTKEGAEGIQKYIDATSDQSAAEKMAKANMEGTAGAIERLRGTWETARLEFAKAIAPTVQDFLDFLSRKIDDLSPKLTEFGHWFDKEGAPAISDFVDEMRPLANDLLPAAASSFGILKGFAKKALPFVEGLVKAFNDMPGWARKTLVGGVVGGTLFVKFGGGSLLKGLTGDLLSKGASPARPLYVWVVNGGVGAGAGLGAPTTAGKSLLLKAGTVTLQGALVTAFAVEVAKAIGDQKDKAPSTFAAFVTGPHVTGGQSEADKLGDPNFFSDKINARSALQRQAALNDALSDTKALFFDTKKEAQGYTNFINTRLPTEASIKILGWDAANAAAQHQLDLINEIRRAHVDSQIDRFSSPTAGANASAGGGGGNAGSGRGGITIINEKVVAQDVNTYLADMQGRAWRASAGGSN